MQNDLISRSALLFVLGNEYFPTKGEFARAMDFARFAVQDAPTVDAVEVGSCDGCYWKEIGRQQKCSCCRRNRYLKDCYEAKMEG